MPTFKVKPETYGATAPTAASKEKYYPTVYFPLSKRMVASLSIGEEVSVTLRGVVSSLESHEGEDRESHECRIEVHEVTLGAENEYEKMSREDD